ncbi:MAG: hypothetical protein R2726_22615 [Acidimicrobiales bacterium]
MLAEVNPLFLSLVVISAIALLFTGFWWLQTVMAERGDIENPHHPGGDERLAELDRERRVASTAVKVVAGVAAVTLLVGLLALLVSR